MCVNRVRTVQKFYIFLIIKTITLHSDKTEWQTIFANKKNFRRDIAKEAGLFGKAIQEM